MVQPCRCDVAILPGGRGAARAVSKRQGARPGKGRLIHGRQGADCLIVIWRRLCLSVVSVDRCSDAKSLPQVQSHLVLSTQFNECCRDRMLLRSSKFMSIPFFLIKFATSRSSACYPVKGYI